MLCQKPPGIKLQCFYFYWTYWTSILCRIGAQEPELLKVDRFHMLHEAMLGRAQLLGVFLEAQVSVHDCNLWWNVQVIRGSFGDQ